MVTLSATQAEVVGVLSGREVKLLVRWPGGFWTYEDCEVRVTMLGGYSVPIWYTTVQTVRAMERKGVLRRTEDVAPEWRAPRELVVK